MPTERTARADPGPPRPATPPPDDTLDLSTGDGHRFAAGLFVPPAPPAGVLAFWPALGTPGRFYHRLGAALAAQGFAVALPDWRGAGSSDRRPGRGPGGDHGFATLVEQDMTALADALAARFPGAPLFVGGHSLGGQLSGLFAARHPARVAGVWLVASGTIDARTYPLKTRAGVTLLARVSGPLAAAVGHFPGRHVGFGGREAAGVMADWSHVARTGRYALRHSAVDDEAAIAASPVPLRVLSFPGDTWSPAASGKAYLDKFRRAGAGSGQDLWDDAAEGTADKPFDHFSWARTPEPVARHLAAWMRAQGADPTPAARAGAPLQSSR